MLIFSFTNTIINDSINNSNNNSINDSNNDNIVTIVIIVAITNIIDIKNNIAIENNSIIRFVFHLKNKLQILVFCRKMLIKLNLCKSY